MASQSTVTVTPGASLAAAVAANIGALPRTRAASYCTSQGNTDAIYFYGSNDGSNYAPAGTGFSGAGTIALPDTIKYVKAVGTPTAENGITPILTVSGTFQDNQTSVNQTLGVGIPHALAGGNAGPAGTGTPQAWQASKYHGPGSMIVVSNGTNNNYWVNLGLTVTQSTTVIPGGLSAASPTTQVTDGGVTWTIAGQGTTTPVSTYADGSVIWIGGVPTTYAISTFYGSGACIQILQNGSTTVYNFWVNVGTTGQLSAGVASTLNTNTYGAAQIGTTTVADTALSWVLVGVGPSASAPTFGAWAKNTSYVAAVASGTVQPVAVTVNGLGLACLQLGLSINNALGPAAWVDTQNTSLFPTGCPRSFSVTYANGGVSDQLTMYGSPDGSNWTALGDVNGDTAVFTGSSACRFLANVSLRYIGAYVPPNGSTAVGSTLRIDAVEYNVTASGGLTAGATGLVPITSTNTSGGLSSTGLDGITVGETTTAGAGATAGTAGKTLEMNVATNGIGGAGGTSGNGGVGSGIVLLAAAGGVAGSTTGTGGAGGAIVQTSGAGGAAAAGTGAGGNGGAFTTAAGAGGAASATAAAGTGGNTSSAGGVGGAGFASDQAGGVGGTNTVAGGAGGVGATGEAPGAGGAVNITGGAAGAQGSGTGNGNGGAVNILGGAKTNSGTLGAVNIAAAAGTLGFFGATAVVQQTQSGNTTTFVAGASTAVTATSTWTGGTGATAYTIGDLVKILKAYGLAVA